VPATPHQTDLTAAAVRRRFIEFFESRAHTNVPSSTTVPTNDPSLRDTFANAGMNQYKPIFLGQVPPGSYLEGLTRATNSQKCIRAGGKHNDLDDVGKDTYHHTFFEMLGNWSFGDYFKDQTIAWAWEFFTDELGLDPTRLYATYFGGDEALGLEPDTEARDLWLRHLPESRVLPFGMGDNFWEMGDTGPCGPCSEIHYDRIGGRDAASLVNMDDPDVLELWNLVFIQFERMDATTLRPLPAKHVDTGMGLERIVSVLQDKRSNYDTDLFTPLFDALHLATGAPRYAGKIGAEDTDGIDEAYRVIADHARCLTVAITDGGMPSNEGRGYVLRRILRRAVRYGRQKLGAKEGFLADLVPTVVHMLGDAFPELKENPERVAEIVREEEVSFGKTLEKGTDLFNRMTDSAVAYSMVKSAPDFASFSGIERNPTDSENDYIIARYMLDSGGTMGRRIPRDTIEKYVKSNRVIISGEDAFQLYDTYGFPLDLTQIMAEERGLTVDIEGFDRAMSEQKARSRAGGRKEGGAALTLGPEELARLRNLGVPATDDADKFHARETSATVRAIWNGSNFDQHVRRISSTGEPVLVVLDKTNHYAEMGGQVADHGHIEVLREQRGSHDPYDGGRFEVEDVKAFGEYVAHIGHVTKGEIRVNDNVSVKVGPQRRAAVASNHTATHLLNHKLRQVVGGDCDQRGSLVAPDKLRFDFTASGPVEPEQLGTVEEKVRADIDAALPVHADLAPLEQARQIHGLRAVFDETYPDPVRVVSVGVPVADLLKSPDDEMWSGTSVEFCGGTHVASTADIGAFALVSEEGIAKGIRRITALTGVPAQAAIATADNLEQELAGAESAPDAKLPDLVKELTERLDSLTLPASRKHTLRQRLDALAERAKQARKAAAAGRAAEAQQLAQQMAANARNDPGQVIVNTIELGQDRKALDAALSTIVKACPTQAVMLLSTDPDSGKVAVMASVPKALVDRGLKAGDWIRETTSALGGKGGGRPERAQGGADSSENLKEAIATAQRFAHSKIM